MTSRRILILLIAVAILALLITFLIPNLFGAEPATYPGQFWRANTPEEQGLDSGKLADGLLAMQAQGTKIDGLLVIRRGALILEAYFYPFQAGHLHDLASVTKSFTTTLVGIAIDQGKLKLDDKLLSFFPDRQIANRDARKEAITIEHLVSMRNGFESGCLEGDPPTLAKMSAAPDWVQWALDRPMVAEPGTQNCYDSPGMHLLSAILQQVTGQTEAEFARQNLFEPLGISEFYWAADPQGITRGWGELHLKPADMARLGYLWLQGGQWEGRQVVSEQWVKDSVAYHSDFGNGDGYGYGWWLWEGGYQASGRGGQAIKVVPGMEVVVATTAGWIDYDAEVDPYLVGAVVDLEHPLPPDPQGNARLAETLTELSRPAQDQARLAGIDPPPAAAAVSGKSYTCPPNPALAESLGFDFGELGALRMKFTGDPQEVSWALSISYQPSSAGDVRRGAWVDAQTYVMEVYDIDRFHVRFTFSEGQVAVAIPEYGMNFVCAAD